MVDITLVVVAVEVGVALEEMVAQAVVVMEPMMQKVQHQVELLILVVEAVDQMLQALQEE